MIETKDRRHVTGKGYVSVPSLASIPISSIDRKNHHLAIKYKALAFHEDRKNSSLASVTSFVIEEKRAAPVWNSVLNAWQCAEGTRYGGRFTDRFGRGCGGGILRRLGSALGRLGDVDLFQRLENVGERRDLRRLARYSARQSYRDELGRIREAYPSLGRRALRRIGGTFRRVDNALAAGPMRLPRRSRRGSAPKKPSIVTRLADRSGDAFERLINRALYGRRRGQRGQRTRLTARAARRQQRGQTPRQPGAVRRLADRAGNAYERLIDRVLYGPQKRGRRGRRGLGPAQAGATTIIPKKPKTPRSKKKKAVVQKTKPKPAVAPKKVKKTGLIDIPSLDAIKKKQLEDKAAEQLAYLDNFWRKRLGIADGDPIPDDAIDKYIQDRIDANKPGAYIGMLKANRNDYKALRTFKEKLDANDPDAYAELNNVGPTRRNALVEAMGITTPSKPKPAKKPKPKKIDEPDDVTPDVVDETPAEEVIPEPEAVEPDTGDVVPEEVVEEEALPDFLQPEPEPEATEEPEGIVDDIIDEEPTEPEVAEPEEIVPTAEEEVVPDVPDFLQPEPDPAATADPTEAPLVEPAPDVDPPLPPIDITSVNHIEDPDLPSEIATESIALAQAQQVLAQDVQEALDQLGVSKEGAIGNSLFDADADGLEDALAYAKEVSQLLSDQGLSDESIFVVRIKTDSDDKYIVTLPSIFDINAASDFHVNEGKFVPVYKNGTSIGTYKWSSFEKLIEDTKLVPTKTWSSAGIVETKLTTKGLKAQDVKTLLNDLFSRAKVLNKNTILISAIQNKKATLIGGTKEEVIARIKELGLDKPDTVFTIVAVVDSTTENIHLADSTWKQQTALPLIGTSENFYIQNGGTWLDSTYMAGIAQEDRLEKIFAGVEKKLSEWSSNSTYNNNFSSFTGTNHWYLPINGTTAFKDLEVLNTHIDNAINSDSDWRKFRLIRRSPSSGNMPVSFSTKLGYIGLDSPQGPEIGRQFWKSTSLPNESGPNGIYALMASMKSLHHNDNDYSQFIAHLVRVTSPNGSESWQIVDQARIKFLIDNGFVKENDAFLKARFAYGASHLSWNTNFSKTTGSANYTDYTLEDLPILSASVNAAFPDLNLPLEKFDDAVIEIDETYNPAKSVIAKLDPDQAKTIITDFLEGTESGQKFLVAAKYASKNEIVKKKPYKDLTVEDLETQLESAQKALDNSLTQIPVESSAYGALANPSKVSHNKAAKAYATVKALEELIAQKKAEGDIAEVSKTIAKALGIKPFTPDNTPFEGGSGNPLTLDEAIALAQVTPIDELPALSEFFEPFYVDAWLPAYASTAYSSPSGKQTYYLGRLNNEISKILQADDSLTPEQYREKVREKIKELISEALSDAEIKTWTVLDAKTQGEKQILLPNMTKVINEALVELSQSDGWPGEETLAKLENIVESVSQALREDVEAAIESGEIDQSTGWFGKVAFQNSAEELAAIGSLLVKEKSLEVASSYIKGLNTPSAADEKIADAISIVDVNDPIPFAYSADINIADTFGLLSEQSVSANTPMLVWLRPDVDSPGSKYQFVAGTYEQFKSDADNNLVASVLGGVTPNGKIYVASGEGAENPTAKWVSKFGKYGTGGWKVPVGAAWSFESEDAFENLDLLTEVFGNKRILPSSTATNKSWYIDTPKGSSPVGMNPPGEAKGLDKYVSMIAGDSGVDEVLDEPIPYEVALQILNPYGLVELVKSASDGNGGFDSTIFSTKSTMILASGPGENGPNFYLIPVGDEVESERLAAKEFLQDKAIIGVMYQDGDGDINMRVLTQPRLMTTPEGTPTATSTAFDSNNLFAALVNSFPNYSYATLTNYVQNIDEVEIASLSTDPFTRLTAIIAASKQLFANKSGHDHPSLKTVSKWFEGDVDLPDVDSIDLPLAIHQFAHGTTGTMAKGLADPSDADLKNPYYAATAKLNGMHLLVPWLSSLFDHLDKSGSLTNSSALEYDTPAYEVIAGQIGEVAGTPLGEMLGKLAELVDGDDSLKTPFSRLSKAQFDYILSSVIGGEHSPKETLEFVSALRHQIQSLTVGGRAATSRLDKALSEATDVSTYAADAVDIHGVSLHDLQVDEVIDLIAKTRAASDAEFFQLLKDSDIEGLHPIAHNAALIGRRSSQLMFVRSVVSTIRLRQDSDPEGAALLRSALRNYLETDLLINSTPPVYKNRVIDWLNSGGYPDLSPNKGIYDETTGIPVASIGKFNPSLLGSVSSDGKAIGSYVPPHTAIPDMETALAHVSSGGSLSEVPDLFLRDVIVANMGPGLRFLPDESISGGFNKDVFGFFDTANPGSEPNTYKRYVVKFADRNANEHINEIMGSQLEHRLGLFAVGHRVASPVKKKTDKNGNLEPQRAIVQEHIANLFEGSDWKVIGHWGSVSSSDPIDPESLARFVALNRFMNHYDRTPANVIAVRAPDGKIHIVPIDDGNGFYGFMAKKAGQKADTAGEQAAGFVQSVGVGLDWFGMTSSMSKDDKLTFAIALKEATDKFLSMDLEKMQQEIIDAHPWTDEELAHIASRFDTLKDRQQNRDWQSMLTKAYSALGVAEPDVDSGLESKKKAVYSGIAPSDKKNSPQGAFQSLIALPKRNISAGYFWDGPSVDRQQVLVGSATLVSAPFDEDNGKLAMYSTLQLAGDAREKAVNLQDGVDGWQVLKKANGSPLDKPVSASYRQLVGTSAKGPYGNKRSLVLNEPSTEFGLTGTNYYKKLDDGTVVIVFVASNKSDVFSGYTTFYRTTNDPDNKVLSIPNADEIMGSVLGEFGGTSEPPTQEVVTLSALKQLAHSLLGGGPNEFDDKSEAELLALLSSWGIGIGDLELDYEFDGEPFMRLTKEARRKIADTINRPTIKHRYYHHDDGEVKAFVNTMLTGRLASARRRIPHGIPGAGWSTSADSGYQSNDYVFFKFGDAKYLDPKMSIFDDLDDDTLKSLVTDGNNSHIYSYFPTEFVVERPTTRWTIRDNFGNIEQHVSITASVSSTSAPEPLIRDSMPMARGIHVIPSSIYDDVIARIKSQGVTEIAGIPIEALVVSSSDDMAAAWKTLRQYWIDLGWV